MSLFVCLQAVLIKAPLGAIHHPYNQPSAVHSGAGQHSHVDEQRQLRAGAGGRQAHAQVRLPRARIAVS